MVFHAPAKNKPAPIHLVVLPHPYFCATHLVMGEDEHGVVWTKNGTCKVPLFWGLGPIRKPRFARPA
jgi:hypothetical protein